MSPDSVANKRKLGLVLSGGGARGAYQAGVLLALAEIRAKYPECRQIRVITGVSAGAINAAFMAANCDSELKAARQMAKMWRSLTSDDVFRTDAFSLGRIGFKWLLDTTFGSLKKHKQAKSLLDTAPLRDLLEKYIRFERIPELLNSGHLDAFSVTALNYSTSHSIAFVQSKQEFQPWDRSRRRSEAASIGADHVMASAALPLFFPPVPVEDGFFGDGSLRNTAPLSPAIHLGAGKIIVVSVRRPEDKAKFVTQAGEPTIARVLGVMLNALLMDATEFDMERLTRINATLGHVPTQVRSDLHLRKIEALWLRPSEDIGFLASGQFDKLPTIIHYLMGGLGNSNESSELTSYLLFDPEYCGKLVDLGHKDGWAQVDAIREFLST
ncbi:MAG: patatin-like phospholipase family protein [Bdellovibrionaceae bacterium]|nr:patatin-like phospholipase family protein [Pseudobdellovibrionaceae bacterium]